MTQIVARMDKRERRGYWWAAAACLQAVLATMPGSGQAAQVVRFSPEGEVARVRQVAIRFDEAMVPLGDLQASPPATVSCNGSAITGQARWIDAKNWAFDFARDLPPGVKCTVRMVAGLKSEAGKAYTGKPEYRFETGGPTVVSARPGGGEIEEDQVFALRFNGPAIADLMHRLTKPSRFCGPFASSPS